MYQGTQRTGASFTLIGAIGGAIADVERCAHRFRQGCHHAEACASGWSRTSLRMQTVLPRITCTRREVQRRGAARDGFGAAGLRLRVRYSVLTGSGWAFTSCVPSLRGSRANSPKSRKCGMSPACSAPRSVQTSPERSPLSENAVHSGRRPQAAAQRWNVPGDASCTRACKWWHAHRHSGTRACTSRVRSGYRLPRVPSGTRSTQAL